MRLNGLKFWFQINVSPISEKNWTNPNTAIIYLVKAGPLIFAICSGKNVRIGQLFLKLNVIVSYLQISSLENCLEGTINAQG